MTITNQLTHCGSESSELRFGLQGESPGESQDIHTFSDFLAAIIHFYSAWVMKRASRFTQISPLLTKAMRSGLWGHIVAFKRAPHVFVLISYGNNGPEQANIHETKKTRPTRKFHSENGFTNLLFDYNLCDQLLGPRRRREIRQRGRLFARRSDPGRSL